MSSLRHIPSPESPRDGYLDAARACILDVGWRRTTLTEVARRADVSRMTIYRAWSDMPTLLGDLLTREWTQLTDHAVEQAAPHTGDPVGLMVELTATTIEVLRTDEFFVRIVELDPELILPYLLARRGRSQDLILGRLVALVEDGQGQGEVRAGHPVVMARALLLAAHGFVLSAHTMIDDEVTREALDAEWRLLAERVLQP